MIERVARALYEREPAMALLPGSAGHGIPWERIPDDQGPYREMARAAIEAMPGWEPTETAPKDGSTLLLYSSSYEEAQTGRWAWAWQLPKTLGFKDRSLDTTEGYWVEKPYIDYDEQRYPYRPIHDVTHWRPNAEPPIDTALKA